MASHFELPAVPPRMPGPFAFEEPDYVRDILTKAGFADIKIAGWEGELPVGGGGTDPESAGDFLMQATSIAQRAMEAPEPLRMKVRNELCERLKAFATPVGVAMRGAVWFVTGRA